MNLDVRWRQRFQHFDRAMNLLQEPLTRGLGTLSALEKEGTIQRFEYALELAWKTLKDYLEYEGAIFEPLTPRHVMKEAFAAKIIADGQVWLDMLDHRNLLSHAYDAKIFEQALQAMQVRYFPAMKVLHAWFAKRIQPQ